MSAAEREGVKREQRSNAAERPGEKVPEAPQDVARRTLLVTWARAVLMQSGGRGHTVAKRRWRCGYGLETSGSAAGEGKKKLGRR